ncbi:MAG: hypothetical protein ABI378_02550 [Chitinophagaceae bacterium]
MIRTVRFAFLLSCFALIAPQISQAQFLKKLFGKEESPKHKPVRQQYPVYQKKPEKPVQKSAEKKAEPRFLAETKMKARYRIDVFASVFLNELVANGKPVYKSHLPAKVLPGLGFYQGIKLAADTINSFGYKMDVYFHDITSAGNSPEVLMKNGSLDSSDLIIGSVHASLVGPLAAFAKKHHINFVSTLSPFDANVLSNPYFSVLQPTLTEHCEAIKKPVSEKSRFTNILVFRRSTNALDESCFQAVVKDSPFVFTQVLMNTPMPADRLRNFLDSSTSNVVVMPIVDEKYSLQLLDLLNKSFPNFKFEVYGMPSWKAMPVLQNEGSLSNIGITIGAPFFFDPSSSAGKEFSDYYTNVYGGRAPEMAYRGYEVLYWFAYLLHKYGTIFNDHFQDNGVAPFTRFNMKLGRTEDGTPRYFENTHVYLYRYQAGSFSVLPE